MRITEESWFQWNPKLVAEIIAFLDKQGQREEAETIILETLSKLESRERELVLFYCNLIDSFCKHDSKRGFDDTYARLNQLVNSSSSVYVKRQALKSMISGLCEMGQPHEAENLIEEMRVKGLEPSGFEYKCIIYGYGRLGLLEDMERIVNQMESDGTRVDTVCSNMVLSSYGDHNELSRMVLWLQKMKDSGIPFSVRTYNSVLNSCSTIMSMLQDLNSNDFPLSLLELTEVLNEEEVSLVKELEDSSVLDEAMKWDSGETKLDLHGMHLGSAYFIILQWMDEMRNRFNNEKHVIPAEITVVCGSGKHSTVRGESPVKAMVKKMMVRTSSPLRVHRNNIGCFIAKGHVVKDWLC